MSDQAHQQLLALTPPGGAFPRAADSVWGRALRPLADELARVEREAEALLDEVDPGTSVRLLPDYERVLGDDPCVGPAAALPIEMRQRLARLRWTASGGATPAFFVALAAGLGIDVQVVESQPWEVSIATVDDELIDEPGRFEWFLRIRPPQLRGEGAGGGVLAEDGTPLRIESGVILTSFEVGVADVDTPIEGLVGSSPVECLARRHAPAHTTVYIAYG